MNRPSPTVFIVDDDESVRRALFLSLSQRGLAVKAYKSAEVFLEEYQPSQPGCLLLDLRLREMDGLELQMQLKQRHCDIPVIFISGHGNVSSSVSAMKLGALDFLEKPLSMPTLLQRIEIALQEDRNRRHQHAVKLEARSRYAQLTAREQQVMATVVLGLTNKEIARQLKISFRTVEKYRASVMQKMDVQNLAELCHLSEMCGLGEENIELETEKADKER